MAIPFGIFLSFITKESKSVELARIKKEHLLRFGMKEDRNVDRVIEVLEYELIFKKVKILAVIPLTPGVAKLLGFYFTTALGYIFKIVSPG